eukprot:m.59573 g.59573  ORF g.59573 m.59573 type:complete len:380 (-) comp13235_c1_seq1:106-1245(-)
MATTHVIEPKGGEKLGLGLQRFLVTTVSAGGPADRAGLKPGMKISHINGTNVQDMSHVQIIALIKASGNVLEVVVGGSDATTTSTPTTTSAPTSTSTSAPTPSVPTTSVPRPIAVPSSAAPAEVVKPLGQQPDKAQRSATSEQQQEQPKPQITKPEPSQPAKTPSPTMTSQPQNESKGPVKQASSSTTADKLPSGPSEPKKIATSQKMLLKNDKGEMLSVDAPICTACNEPILTSFLEFDGGRYHRGCFTCGKCGANLAKTSFSASEEGLICQQCWAKENGLTCAGCNSMILPDIDKPVQYVTINDKHYHKDCVKCVECGLVFGPNVPGPYSVGDDVLCKDHAMARRRRSKDAQGQISENDDDARKLNSIMKASRSGWK